ncbi:DNA repair protein RecN [Caldifermentibacillus hisashii]|uniref:hypothetical protein n=1 Tax=Caldifermentibacillus hisashii TaxID=996558 RepID=UPI00114073F8|nr:hypothetical protein [Caldifermentibacillus hisashii]
MIDEFAGEPVKEALADYRALYRRYADLKKEWKNLSENEQQLAQRLDLLKFQWKEIADARLEPGEDEALEAERRKFIHFERLYQSLSAAYDALSGEGKAMDWLGIALSQLENAAEIDPSWQRYQENFSSSYYGAWRISCTSCTTGWMKWNTIPSGSITWRAGSTKSTG